MKIHIGNTTFAAQREPRMDALYLDLPTLIETRALVTGNSGSGKSRLLRRIAEQAFGKVQIILLDPEGEFGTLRERHDFLLVGKDGEVQAEPRAAALLARRLMELHLSAVVDLYDLAFQQRRAFVRYFLASLMELPKDKYAPTLVVLDEAHLFCPEEGDAESAEAVIDLMSRGRKKGLCGILATQRLSKLAKDAAAEAKNNFIGGIALDLDQKRAAAILGLSAHDRIGLRDLSAGTFLTFGPALSERGVTEFVSGDVLTYHPKTGKNRLVPVPPTPEAIRKVAAELKDLPQQAAEEIRTLEAAKARIAALEREVRALPKPAPAAVSEVSVVKLAHIERIESAIQAARDAYAQFFRILGGQEERLEIREKALMGAMDALAQALASARRSGEVSRISVGLEALKATSLPPDARLERVAAGAPLPPWQERSSSRSLSSANGFHQLPAPQRMLRAIALCNNVTERKLAVVCGIKRGGSTWRGAVARLRNDGMLERGTLALTADGRAATATLAPQPRGLALREHWLGELGNSTAQRVLLELLRAYPNAMTAEDLGARLALEVGGSTWRGAMAKLRSLDLIPRNEFKASADLFD